MIVLAPMNPEEFAAYVERAVPAYAQDKVSSGQWSPESSLQLSRQAIDELLPKGPATPDNFLFTLREGATNARVGMLWYAIQERAGQRIAFVYDVLVEPEHRRMGYGARAFEAIEAEAASRGLHGIGLHVFGHNETARALYAKLGYRATNVSMFKPLPDAPA